MQPGASNVTDGTRQLPHPATRQAKRLENFRLQTPSILYSSIINTHCDILGPLSKTITMYGHMREAKLMTLQSVFIKMEPK